ncbi:MAG: hypothetical protein KF760_25225 [Candidatus Eremiobacteraeota bacterium]|nr:hypothetical protein [Candidatus Eremiobacteraeota bacterium]MCW5872168.1 hypothetical protein [Candidatus Eremiobacteraeota bacterium]
MKFRILLLCWLLLPVAWPEARLDWASPFAVDGVRLGDSKQQVFKALGAPRESSRSQLEVWKYKDLEVTFRSGDVCRLYGLALQQNNQTLVRVGELAAVVRGRFGEPESNQALGVQQHPEVEVMMYQNATTTIGVFSRAGRVSLVGLSRRS